MSFDYAKTAQTASGLLARFGQSVTLTKVTPGTYDPDTGTMTPDVTQTQTVRAAVFPYSNGDRLIAGGMIKQGDRQAYIAPDVEWAPDATTKLTEAGGAVWQLENVEPLAPAGVPVLYTANATK